MEPLKLYWVDAFTDRPFSGNPAAVIVNANNLSDEQKQAIAREMNLSETVFISESNVADFRVQFFTPKQETALCGHGTVAAFWVLASIGKIGCMNQIITVKQETLAGVLPIEVYFDESKMPERVMMHQNLPVFFEEGIQIDEIATILDISVDKFDDVYPLKVVSTGRPKLFIPIKSRTVLYGIKPNFDKITDYCIRKSITGFHLFTFDTHSPDSITTARHFAPSAGVNEDPVTGIAAGALGCYLIEFDKNTKNSQLHFQMEQGFNMNKGGVIDVEIAKDILLYQLVKVGGKASILFNTDIKIEPKAIKVIL